MRLPVEGCNNFCCGKNVINILRIRVAFVDTKKVVRMGAFEGCDDKGEIGVLAQITDPIKGIIIIEWLMTPSPHYWYSYSFMVR